MKTRMKKDRLEQDSLGTLAVPADALYGAQTQRALNNFPISGQPLPAGFVRALLLAKYAAAHANGELGQIPVPLADAICASVEELLAGEFMAHFPVDVFQTGSGTSTNMNANEVLATLAARRTGTPVSANDHVNCGQSSNDSIPSAIHIGAALALHQRLLPALNHLETVTRAKAASVDGYVKTGRTHLMDAMPVRLSQSLLAWADQLAAQCARLQTLLPELLSLAQGGTAVGTGINAHPEFAARFCVALNQKTGLPFRPADNFFTQLGSHA